MFDLARIQEGLRQAGILLAVAGILALFIERGFTAGGLSTVVLGLILWLVGCWES
ncbi:MULTISPECIES: hypothetical protein [unclassified Thioalkalivibrio]|uniref:hypothetical protein n=1 Tax=unclassified Thioalkalivibrio TaxID=2621013 RepID=UPI00036F9215|nr:MULTISPECIES: hypothetical protein [unclassified Thioalkalivibrio]